MNTSISPIIEAITKSEKATYIVGIAGGSASGKSWTSNSLRDRLLRAGYQVAILHLDDFALGKEFAHRKTSPYKWDDPDNYRLNEAFLVLQDLLAGRERQYLAYTLEAHRPVQSTQLAWAQPNNPTGRRIVVIEGLFPWSGAFNEIVDLKVFLDSNFFRRFVLRLYRNVMVQQVVSFEKVAEQYFSFVKRAHFDLLMPQKDTADIVITNDIDLGQTLTGLAVLPDGDTPAQSIYRDADLFIGYRRNETGIELEICVDGKPVMRGVVSEKILASILH